MPGFCCECGERLQIKQMKRAAWWPARAFCYHCAPAIGGRRPIVIGALILAMLGSFLVGRYSRKPEPFYFIGSPVETHSTSTAVSTSENNGTEDSQSATIVQPGNETKVYDVCGAVTRSGKRCQRRVKGGGFCWQHRAKVASPQPAGPGHGSGR